jgi:hypothetical protein
MAPRRCRVFRLESAVIWRADRLDPRTCQGPDSQITSWYVVQEVHEDVLKHEHATSFLRGP